MSFELVRVLNDEQLNILASTANEVWHEFFPCILSPEQIDYMVDKFQSYDAMKKQMEDGYEYYFLMDNDEICGYMGIHEETSDKKMFLSKLYLKKEHRGKGIADKMFACFLEEGYLHNVQAFTLEVRVSNQVAISLYQKYGFENAGIRKKFYEEPTEDAMIMWKKNETMV